MPYVWRTATLCLHDVQITAKLFPSSLSYIFFFIVQTEQLSKVMQLKEAPKLVKSGQWSLGRQLLDLFLNSWRVCFLPPVPANAPLWFSGRILVCHVGDQGLIPGWVCNYSHWGTECMDSVSPLDLVLVVWRADWRSGRPPLLPSTLLSGCRCCRSGWPLMHTLQSRRINGCLLLLATNPTVKEQMNGMPTDKVTP